MAADDDSIIPCSHPYPALASASGEDDGRCSSELGVLSSIVGEAGKGEVPHGQSILSGTADEANMKEGEVVCTTTCKTTISK